MIKLGRNHYRDLRFLCERAVLRIRYTDHNGAAFTGFGQQTHDLNAAAGTRDGDDHSVGWNRGKLQEFGGVLYIYRTTSHREQGPGPYRGGPTTPGSGLIAVAGPPNHSRWIHHAPVTGQSTY